MALTDIIHLLENSILNIEFLSGFAGIRPWIPYGVIFISTMIEGPIAMLTAAAISATGLLNPILVFSFAASGNLAADFCYFLVGRLGRFEMIAWVLKKARMDQEKIDKLKANIIKNSAKTIFVAKLSNSLIIPMLLVIGTVRIPIRRWAPALIAGELLWSSLLMVAGYFFSNSIQKIEADSHYLSLAVSIVLVVVAIFWLQRRFGKRTNLNN
jgi:membrane protein DedA with SNARE-associated domain